MRNLCHFDVQIGDVLYPAAERPLVLDPILSPTTYQIGGCPVRDLHGFQVPDHLLDLASGDDLQVIVPRLAPAISLARDAGLDPYTVPLRLMGDRGRPGPVVLTSENDLEPAPAHLAVPYLPSYLRRADFEGGEVVRRVKGAFPIRVAGGPTFSPIPDDLAATDLPDGGALCPQVDPGAAAVIVPHSGPVVHEYARRGHAVLVTSTVKSDGTVDLYRVA